MTADGDAARPEGGRVPVDGDLVPTSTAAVASQDWLLEAQWSLKVMSSRGLPRARLRPSG